MYPRTYRSLTNNYVRSIIYLLVCTVLPFYWLGTHLDLITSTICDRATEILEFVLPQASVETLSMPFSKFGTMYYLDVAQLTSKPENMWMIYLSIAVIFVLCLIKKNRFKPLSLFLMFEVGGFLINCILFQAETFPYTMLDFSELYMVQQIGIWLFFIVIYGITTAFLGSRGYMYKVLSTFMLMVYSLLVGFIRYVVFLYILSIGSSIYMYLMFFTFGPLFDFLYLVSIYGLLVDRLIKVYEVNGKQDWLWY